MKDHAEVLDLLLANACGALPAEAVASNDGYQLFIIDVCCGKYHVEAKLINDHAPFKYTIRKCVRV